MLCNILIYVEIYRKYNIRKPFCMLISLNSMNEFRQNLCDKNVCSRLLYSVHVLDANYRSELSGGNY